MAGREQALVAQYQRFAKELARQQATFATALAGMYTLDASTPQVTRGGAWYCLIRLHDAWAHFCRQAIILSAAGGVLTKSGTMTARSPLLQPGDDVMTRLKQQWKATKQSYIWMKQGPALEVPIVAITAARLLQISNYKQFAAGIGAAANAPVELKAVRNFLAHRHFGTAVHPDIIALRQRINAAAPSIDVACLPARYPTIGGPSVFEDWCLELVDLASAAVD